MIIRNVSGAYFTAIRYDEVNARLILDISSGHQHIYNNVTAEEASRIMSDADPAGKVAVHVSGSGEHRVNSSKT